MPYVCNGINFRYIFNIHRQLRIVKLESLLEKLFTFLQGIMLLA